MRGKMGVSEVVAELPNQDNTDDQAVDSEDQLSRRPF